MRPRWLCLPFVILLTASGFGVPGQSVANGDKRAPGRPPATAAPRDENAIARGRKTYTTVGCYQCHGREGQGSPASGPRIGPGPPPLATFLAYVRAPAGEMPPYTTKVISDAELTDIHAFLEARAPAVPNVPLP
jgi:mono/diheme cytochrome c family protein